MPPLPSPSSIIVTLSIITIFTPITVPPVMRARAPATAPTFSKPAVPPKELPPQLPADHLYMHEVTVSPSVAAILLILAACRLAEICHWREISYDRTARVKSTLQRLQGSCGVVFLLELNINVANHVVGEVVTNVQALDLTELAQLFEDVLVEILKVLLDLAGIDRLALGVNARRDHVRPMVHVGEK